MKAKGLQKLRFWCEMCSKQCRDANGFKCHLTSESHLRQMKLFSENAGSILKQKSVEFEQVFLEHLRLRHSNVSVNANNVYQQVIRDKMHVHMNATMWTTLSDFVQYLGKTGKCAVEENERGWYVKYIPMRDAAEVARQENMLRRQEADRLAEQQYIERIEQQRKEGSLDTEAPEATSKDAMAKAVHVSLGSVAKSQGAKSVHQSLSTVFGSDDECEEDDIAISGLPQLGPSAVSESKKRFREQDGAKPAKKTKQPQTDTPGEAPWLYKGIIVRIVYEKLKFFKQKAVVEKVENKFTARVSLLDDGKVKLLLDQSHVETVVPKHRGDDVLVVKGKYGGKKATVVELSKKECKAILRISGMERMVEMDFDDFSKLHEN